LKKTAFALLASFAILMGCETSPPAPAAAAKPAAAPAIDSAKKDAINTGVVAALKKDEFTKKYTFSASTSDDATVTLSGNVDNEFQQWYSGTVAQKIDGVKKVDNKVKVQ
jgi:osmotically-inducible protein OsmY